MKSVVYVFIVTFLCIIVTISVLMIATSKTITRRHNRLADTTMPPICRLWWNRNEGAMMIMLKVGLNLVSLVLDTGSSVLSVKSSDCNFIECNGKTCDKSKKCPCGDVDGKTISDCGNHVYKPTKLGKKIKAGESGTSHNTHLQYGSQEDTIRHYMDTVSVPYIDVTCQDVIDPQYKKIASSDKFIDIGDNIIIHSVYQIKGASSSNLFGLSRPAKKGENVLLDSLFGKKNMIFSLVIRSWGGFFSLGPLPCFSNLQYVRLLQPVLFKNFVTKFYIIQLSKMFIGPDINNLTQVINNVPKYCLIDTGTTLSYASSKLGLELKKNGYNANTDYMQLHVGSSKNPVILTYSSNDLKDPDYPSLTVLNCLPDRKSE